MSFLEIIQIISNIIVVVGAIFGGIWTYYRFRKLRQVKKSLSINIIPSVYAQGEHTVIEVVIDLLCTGTVPIFISEKSFKRCLIYFKGVPTFEDNTVLDLIDKRYQLLAEPLKYLNHFEASESLKLIEHYPIILEPGVPSEIRGYAILSTTYKGLILLHVEFCDNDDIFWIEGRIIDTKVESRTSNKTKSPVTKQQTSKSSIQENS